MYDITATALCIYYIRIYIEDKAQAEERYYDNEEDEATAAATTALAAQLNGRKYFQPN